MRTTILEFDMAAATDLDEATLVKKAAVGHGQSTIGLGLPRRAPSFGLGCLATSKPKRVPAHFHRTL